MTDIVVVEKTGTLKAVTMKEFKVDELYKKCGFKKEEGFVKQTEWKIKMEGVRYVVEVYGKTDGRANSENKYDFPPPIDNTLFFGACAIVALTKNDNGVLVHCNLSLSLWDKIYEKLFGGFEDLWTTAKEDEEEEDELMLVPKEKKTKQGYLKDGFVVDSSDTDFDDDEDDDDDEDNDDDDDDEEEDEEEDDDEQGNLHLEDIGSELSEESYED